MRRKINRMLSFGLALIMMFSIAGCGSNAQPQAEIDPDTPVSEVQFPLKETEELSFITSAPATSTQDPNERIIFQRLEEQTNVHIKWTCFVSDQFSDKKNLALAQFGNLPDGLFNAGMSDYDLLRYAKQGIIIPLENLIDKYMPNLQAVFENIRNTAQCVPHRMDIYIHFHGSNSLVPVKKPYRPSEISHISIKNGWIILDWKYRQQRMNWNRY